MLASILDRLLRPKEEVRDDTQKVKGDRLPSFDKIREFLMPSGMVIQTEETGWSIQSFMLSKSPDNSPSADGNVSARTAERIEDEGDLKQTFRYRSHHQTQTLTVIFRSFSDLLLFQDSSWARLPCSYPWHGRLARVFMGGTPKPPFNANFSNNACYLSCSFAQKGRNRSERVRTSSNRTSRSGWTSNWLSFTLHNNLLL